MSKGNSDVITRNGKQLTAVQCDFCGRTLYRPRNSKRGNHFCDKKCATNANFRNKKAVVTCHKCGRVILRQRSAIKNNRRNFCSTSCSTSYYNRKTKKGTNHHYWKGGKTNYRKRALETYGHTCMNPDCEVTKSKIDIPIKLLDVDHIDGNRDNNDIENLQILCVWCHAKKTRGLSPTLI